MTAIRLNPLNSLRENIVSILGSKSYTNRALIMAAMVESSVAVLNPLFSDDTIAMIDCLNRLGIHTEKLEDRVIVHGSIKDVNDEKYELNANLSGTTVRFILALCCIIPGEKVISGGEGLLKRPIKVLVEGLRQLGADIEYLDKEGFPPLKVTSSVLNPGKTSLNGDISSQYFSAILMIAPVIGDVEVEVIGNQISKPYIDMTIDTMEEFGVRVINHDYKRYVISAGQKYIKHEYIVEGDFSSAGYFLAIPTLTKTTLILKNLNPYSRQADRNFMLLLEKMGSKIEIVENGIRITGQGVKPMDIDMENCPDQVQTMAVLLAFADGKSVISGVRSLRVKETERVKALETELLKMGIKTESLENVLTIYGGNPKAAEIETYGDHRMAMSFAVAGTLLDGMIINNPEVVSKTFPDFWKKLEELNNGI